MKIAIYHNLPSGGAKRALYEWTSRLASTHEIHVYTLSSADHQFCDLRPLVNEYRIFDFTPGKLYESPFGRLNQFQRWRDLGRLTDIGRYIANEINLGEYDIVFANTCQYTFIPSLLQFLKTPSVYYLHEPFGRRFTRHFQRPYSKNSKWRELLNRIDPFIVLYKNRLETLQMRSLKRTKRILANSQYTQKHMKTALNIDSPVCYYGVDSHSFHPIQNVFKENYVISVGELTPRKGFDFLVNSVGQIPAHQRPQFRIACNSVDSLEEEYVLYLADRQKVEIKILRNLNADELAIQYNKALLCIYAPVMEPLGLVPLESMACGTPVIGVKEGGVPETIVHKHTGILVEREPAKFAKALQYLLNDSVIAAEYGINARDHVQKNWTWDQATYRLESHLMNSVYM